MKQFILFLVMTFSTAIVAQELHTFSNGEVADADAVNGNFQNLDERLTSIEALTTQPQYSELNGVTKG